MLSGHHLLPVLLLTMNSRVPFLFFVFSLTPNVTVEGSRHPDLPKPITGVAAP